MAVQVSPSAQQAAQARAQALWSSGLPVAQVQDTLILEGVNPSVAQAVAEELMVYIGQTFKEQGRKQMLYGAVWIGIGLLVTALTFLGALGSGRPFFIVWGLMALGGIQTVRGLYHFLKGRATVLHYAPRP